MTIFTEFSTPAQQGPKDYQLLGLPAADLAAFEADWSANIAGWTQMSIIGNPWSNLNDTPRDNYYDPLVEGMGEATAAVISWPPFPNRLIQFLTNPGIVKGGQLTAPLSQDAVQELADSGRITQGGTSFVLFDPEPGQVLLKIPADRCPAIDWDGKYVDFSPSGPRGWQDEYCEWSILRNAQGKMQSIAFTCENPAYYLTMWRQNPKAVLGIYQRYIDPAVQLEDLFLRYEYDQPTGKKGDPVLDPTTGNPAYDPTNKWNRGPARVPGSFGGAMHLTSPPNTLSAEIYLAAAATIQRPSSVNGNPQSLICCAQYGQNFRNSDPNIGYGANVAARTARLTLTDPVGLYIQQPQNFQGWSGPNGEDVSGYWQILRGTAGTGPNGSDQILHAVFAIPESAGYSIEDCTIYGLPISHVGVILDQMKVALAVTPNNAAPDTTAFACVTDRTDGTQPWPVQMVPESLFYGESPSDLPALLRPGSKFRFVLIVQGADENTTPATARVEFSDPNITVTVEQFLKNASAVPGQTNGGGTQGYVMDIAVGANAQPGPVSVRALNPSEGPAPTPEQHPWEAGLAVISSR
ncbi:hypothetical protein [Paracoccus denitrificans]|jgi:hypothetical protein|uniref:Uncharacterized protein n=1 Tax=Paracoccus denitrificans (strain Pd 1222) TaxID=318586 RepID=A1BB09_PARDP|nr:hypothetical protein [Paracoccus denitrificans]ABL72703.1 conserved hypothetical protein [Paracoccus denitrificans PD1222]MBB4629278.1 hypothetical protein [Paracoccus denitrificans]MCU7430297.1 hypothetical protein [Paracoccus denitrificans]QAR29672.1 hypothetical protein EO213_25425 [Paracoccus denitrificans]UPV98554.1 hypothetical protein M0K93_23620 [Paracoccus denitrificans]